MDQWCDHLDQNLQRRRGRWTNLDRKGLLLLNARRRNLGTVDRGVGGLGNLVTQLTQRFRGSPNDPFAARVVPQRMNLLRDVGLISGYVPSQAGELSANQCADAKNDRERKPDDNDDRRDTIDVPTTQHRDRRPQCEAQQDGEGQGNKDLSAKIERRDGDYGDGQCPKSAHWRRGLDGQLRDVDRFNGGH